MILWTACNYDVQLEFVNPISCILCTTVIFVMINKKTPRILSRHSNSYSSVYESCKDFLTYIYDINIVQAVYTVYIYEVHSSDSDPANRDSSAFNKCTCNCMSLSAFSMSFGTCLRRLYPECATVCL